MKIKYDKNRYIAVLELSSTAIKVLYGVPKYVEKDISNLERFKDIIEPVSLLPLIDFENSVDANIFKKKVLPFILKRYIQLIKLNPQKFKIIATGFYRTIKNSDELINIIEDNFKSVSLKKHKVSVLNPEMESYFGFVSWASTTNFPIISRDKTFNFEYFLSNRGVHLDIGGSTTEISLFNGIDFSNTISLNLGYEKIISSLLAKRYIVMDTLDDCEKNIAIDVKTLITNHFTIKEQLNFCVLTCSIKGVGGFETHIESKNIEIILNDIKQVIIYVIKDYTGKHNNTPLKRLHHNYLKTFIAYSIVFPILDLFKIGEIFHNSAGTRYGVYHDTLDKLKNPQDEGL